MRYQRIFLAIIFSLVCSLIHVSLFSQLCAGSLGEPVVNITFGSGAGNGPALDTSVTNYNYIFGSCPDDGNYTLANQVPSCFGSTWHSVVTDHTPNDTSGYMMVVNASFAPGEFYVKKVEGLCDNTTYEFAAWIINVLLPSACQSAGIKPNVTFRIEKEDGTILQTYQTGDIAGSNTPAWKQYGVFFQTPPGVNNVVVRMTNNAPGGCGNDLVLDDITFRPCGPLIDVAIENSNSSVYICEGENPTFNFISNVTPAGSNTTYQWQLSLDSGATWTDIPGADQPEYTRLPDNRFGTYQYRLAVAQGDYASIPACSKVMSTILSVAYVPLPKGGASSNTPVCEGGQLIFKANDAGQYVWTGPAGFQSITPFPVIDPVTSQNAGRYYLTITSPEGCVNYDSTDISILPAPTTDAGTDVSICEGQNVQLQAATNTNNYQWQAASTLSNTNILNPFATPVATTTYIFTADNGTCMIDDSIAVTVALKPVAQAGPDKVIIKGDTTRLEGSSNIQDAIIFWQPGQSISSASDLQPVVNPTVTTTYVLSLSSLACGTATDSVIVKVYPGLFVPNAFSPNNDGINDTWRIETLQAYPGAEVKIYNRFGELIYTYSNGSAWWNGMHKNKVQQNGAYPYIINLHNGAAATKGILYLIR
jgi:gliding motility-associated-like protein